MKKTHAAFLLVIIALLCAGCSPGRLAGGNGSETTNGKVVYSDGTAASNAAVRVIDNTNWLIHVRDSNPSIIDSTTTDDAGVFALTTPASSDFVLQIDATGEGAVAASSLAGSMASTQFGTIVLSPYATVRGTVRGAPGAPATVFLAQTRCSTSTGAGGTYELRSVPPGNYPLVLRQGSGGSSELTLLKNAICAAGDTLLTGSLDADAAWVPIDDFEDRDNRTNLGPLLGNGWWEAYSDSFNGGTSALVSPVNAAPLNFAAAILADAAPRGNCLRVSYVPGTQGAIDPHPYPYVYVGFPLGSRLYDLTGFDTLVFFARGNGSVVVEFIQQVPGVMVRAIAERVLSATWTEIRITPANLAVITDWFPASLSTWPDSSSRVGLAPYATPPAQWSDMRNAVNAIHFVCTGGTECWFDDIRLHGVRLADFIK